MLLKMAKGIKMSYATAVGDTAKAYLTNILTAVPKRFLKPIPRRIQHLRAVPMDHRKFSKSSRLETQDLKTNII